MKQSSAETHTSEKKLFMCRHEAGLSSSFITQTYSNTRGFLPAQTRNHKQLREKQKTKNPNLVNLSSSYSVLAYFKANVI